MGETVRVSPVSWQCYPRLGIFFHVNVVEEANRGGYMKFLDKCAILTIEEGDIGSEEIIKNLQ
jgi:hypothetical protein